MKPCLFGWMLVLIASGIGYVSFNRAGADPDPTSKSTDNGSIFRQRVSQQRVMDPVIFLLRGEGLDRLLDRLYQIEIVRDADFMRSLDGLQEEDRGALFGVVYQEVVRALSQHRGRSFGSFEAAVESFQPLVIHLKRTVSSDPIAYLEEMGVLRFSEKDLEEFVEVFLDAFTDETETAQAVASLPVQEVRSLYQSLAREAAADLHDLVGRSFATVKEKNEVARLLLESLRIEVTRQPRVWMQQRRSTSGEKTPPDED